MIIYPKMYLENVTCVTEEMLIKNNIKGIILDVDNTLIYYNKQLLKNVDIWCENLKEKGIKFCIVSNSNNKEKIKMVAETLQIPYVSFGMKPLKIGLNKAKKTLELENKNIAVIGDQIFTDVIGANRNNMFSILVKPLETKDILITKIKRPLEESIIRKYLEKKGEKKNVHK